MTELETVARRYQKQRRAAESTYEELVPLILAARATLTLRQIAAVTGLSWGRIHQLTKEAKDG